MNKDWIEVELGEVCKTTSGGTPSRRIQEYFIGEIPWVKSGELNYNIIRDTEEHISDSAIKNSSAKLFPSGTLLIALYGATIGKLAILGTDASTNQAICGIFENQLFETKFLYHYLFNNRQKLIEQGAGGAQPNISQTILKKLPIPLAPLPEQRAIVAKVEQLFSELDNGIANLKTAQQKLILYKQAVLKKAFEGEFSTVKLEEISTVGTGATPKRGNQSFWDNGKIPWVTSGVVNKPFVYESAEFITETALKETNCKIVPKGTLIVAMYGEGKTRGKCSELLIDATTNQALATIQLHEPYLGYKKYIKYFFEKNYQGLRLLSSGGVQPNLNLSILKNTVLPLPSLPEQNQIVQEIESRLSVCDKVQETIMQNLAKAEALRQSILKKAFSGNLLTEKELSACRNEADYAPASELIKEIVN